MTYVALWEGIGALSLGWSGIVFAAAGSGVAATAVQAVLLLVAQTSFGITWQKMSSCLRPFG